MRIFNNNKKYKRQKQIFIYICQKPVSLRLYLRPKPAMVITMPRTPLQFFFRFVPAALASHGAAAGQSEKQTNGLIPNTAYREAAGTVAVVAAHGSVAIVEAPVPRVRTTGG